MTILKVQGTHLIRDTNSGALINRDMNGLQEYNKKRQMMASQKEEINTIKTDVDNIKKDLSEIKQLMLQLLDKGPNV
jgi:chromosome segregation ATPase